jgi:hypothetical protein
MLIPRYSIRWLLGLTTFSAGVSLILSYAVRDHAWAIGIMAGLWTFVVIGVLYVTAFLGAWLISRLTLVPRKDAGESPFGVGCSESPFAAAKVHADSPPPITG